MKVSLKSLQKEVQMMTKIEMKLGIINLSEEEVNYLQKEAKHNSPRDQFFYGLYLLLEKGNKKEALVWFEKAKKHMNGPGLWRISKKFAELSIDDEEWIEWSMACLRRSAWRQYKLSKMMLKSMKEETFEPSYPQA